MIKIVIKLFMLKIEGSAAAPTAGLHFTDEIIEKIKAKGIEILDVTLHVGLGTFRPVKVDDILEHHMHSEYYMIEPDVADKLNQAKQNGQRIIAVGTTSTRTLEANMKKYGKFTSVHENTDIFIYPGYKYEAINVAAIEDSLRSFMQKNERISITYEGIKGVDYYDVLNKRIDTKNGDDIFMVDQASVLALEKKGTLADLSDLSTINNFSDLVRNQMNANDTLQYVPTSISAFGLYCNEDLLKKHKQKIPKKSAGIYDVCAYFKNKGITPSCEQ